MGTASILVKLWEIDWCYKIVYMFTQGEVGRNG